MDIGNLDINDAIEAEMQREEEQQQRELADLLMREFNDFDYEDEEDEEEEEEEDEGEDDEDEGEEEETDEEDDLHTKSANMCLPPQINRDSIHNEQSPPISLEVCASSDPKLRSLNQSNTRKEEKQEEEDEDDDEDEEEEDDEEEEHEDEVKALASNLKEWGIGRNSSSSSSFRPTLLHSTPNEQPRVLPRPDFQDWAADLDSRPRPRQPAASLAPPLGNDILPAFPPGPPSTDTSEVFGPRVFFSGRSSGPPASIKERPVMKDASCEAVPLGQRKLDQLEILYDARGRRIEELSAELTKTKDAQERELRVLKHRLSLAEGEANGARASHQESQRQLVALLAERDQSRLTVQSLERGLAQLANEKAELADKLSASEFSVETLTSQLTEMTASEGLRRAKEQQSAVLASLRVRHDNQLQELQEALDSTRRDLSAREDALRQTRLRAEEAERLRAEAAESHAAATTRLARQLEDALRPQEDMEGLRARANITDSVNRALQEEVKALREEVAMYEATERCLATNQSASSGENNSSLSAANQSSALQRELERCLANYKAKRQLAERLAEEARTANQCAEAATEEKQALRRRMEEAEAEVEQHRAELEASKRETKRLRDELAKLRQAKEAAEAAEKEARVRLEELCASEERLSELNGELQHQISQIFRDFDDDKKQSVERVQVTWEQHLAQAKVALRDELTEQFGREREALVREGLLKREAAEAEAEALRKELDRAKGEFVDLAGCLQAAEEALAAAKSEHEVALKSLQDKLDEAQEGPQRELELARKRWQEEASKIADSEVAVKAAESRAREAEDRIEKIKTELEETQRRCDAAERLRASLLEELSALREEFDSKRASLLEELERSAAESANLRRDLEQLESDLKTQKLKSEVKDSEIDRLNDQLEQAAQELRAQKPSAVEPQKPPQDWNDRLRDLKRRLEAEFRARFKEYSLQRDAEAAQLHDQLERERLVRLTRWRDQRCAAQQTDLQPLVDPRIDLSVEMMREQFVDALSRIRGEVLAHVSMSRTRAALALQTELGRVRLRANQRFAKQFRLACDQLQGQGCDDRVSRSEVVAALELCLTISGAAASSSSSDATLHSLGHFSALSSFLLTPNVSASWSVERSAALERAQDLRRSCPD